MRIPGLLPDDPADRRLLERVRPPGWENPAPTGRYDLVVVGGGTAGLVSAAVAAGLGARTALVERDLLGGDCLNRGCVPSKALLAAARAAAAGGSADFGAAMARMRRLRAAIAENDAAERFAGLGVDVFLGEGRFVTPDRVAVDGVELAFKRAVIATGARPSLPPIEGLAEARPLTSETVFALESLPARIAIVGGGPVGCELAQAFARFGAGVRLLEAAERILPEEDPDAAAVVAAALAADGVDVRAGWPVRRVAAGPAVEGPGGETLAVDAILVAAGRAPALDGLGLDAAGVDVDADGLVVDDGLRTTSRRIWAAGDVLPGPRFTHLADAQARIAVRNALFPGRRSAAGLAIPRVTYTDPELAAVGHTAASAARAGIEIDAYTVEHGDVDRAVLEGRTEGFTRVRTRKGKGTIVGATIVGPRAGEAIAEVALAMESGLGLGALSEAIHPYPTYAEALRKAGDAWRRTGLTPLARRAIGAWLTLLR